MQIKDAHTSELLPNFAHQIDWVCNALDNILKSIRRKTDAIDAPLTMASIEALSDEEIQYYFSQIGVISYYPDIPRNIQNEILYNLARLQTRLGTPRTVELLCQYVFKDIDLYIEILDNLAFNEGGELVDQSLLDLFDVQVHPSTETLENGTIERLYKNIFSLSRNSQTIRDLYIEYPDNDIDTTVCIALPYDGIQSTANFYNYALCETVIPSGIYIPMGGVLDSTSDSIVEMDIPSQLTLGRIEFTGSLAEGGIPESGVIEEYVPAPALPIVTLISTSYGIYATTSVSYISPGDSTISLRSWNGTGFMGDNFTRDANYVYALYKYSRGSGLSNPCGIFVVDWYDNLLCAKNIASNISAFYCAMVATCDSPDATVITVYNASNEAFNAFKFTVNGTDYYYVLDDTQTDWTDDLSSIWYHLQSATT